MIAKGGGVVVARDHAHRYRPAEGDEKSTKWRSSVMGIIAIGRETISMGAGGSEKIIEIRLQVGR